MITFNEIKNKLPLTTLDYVNRLKNTAQSTTWHPEGNVLVHTKVVFNRALKSHNINIILAGFFHDLGKVDTTEPNDKGGFSAHGHELVSCDLVKYSRLSIIEFKADPNIVYWLVKNHMRVKYIDDMTKNKKKDLTDHQWFPLLSTLAACDSMKTLNVFEVIKAGGNPFKYILNKMG
jgi:hypothetical protein